MATKATVTLSKDPNYPADVSERYVTEYGTWTCTASTDAYKTSGLVFNLSGIGAHSSIPVKVEIWDEDPADGFSFRFVKGTNLSNGAVEFMTGTAGPQAQVADDSAIDATISSSVLKRFSAKFIKGR